MALTPDDVLKKSFAATQFRRGYDEREVDDFLDEVVSELRDLIAERDDYKRKYEESVRSKGQAPAGGKGRRSSGGSSDEVNRLKAELAAATKRADEASRRADRAEQGSAGSPDAALVAAREDAAAARAEAASVRDELAAAEQSLAQARSELAKAQAAAPATTTDTASGAAGLIELAQRLHDEHVARGVAEQERLLNEGRTEREALISEGTRKRDELVGAAQQRHDQLITEGQQRHKKLIADGTAQHETLIAEATKQRDGILEGLAGEKATLEQAVASLRSFEAAYRESITTFLKAQLMDVESVDLSPREGH